MASIGGLQLSMLSGSQKNVATLAEINFDFSIVKVSPPAEYREVGQCLSAKRKHEAEDGPLHGVARKLAALFADEIPAVPDLIQAYGKRASSIAANRKVNPRGSHLDGAFADHVGADGTSIWAAATSGHSAIAVHLLACLLARIWPAREAISIFAQLVAAKKTILEKRTKSEHFTLQTVSAAQVVLSREQIAEWDASARSWLRTGDEAHSVQQDQIMLIVKNVGLALKSGSDVYAIVVNAWLKSLKAVNDLLAGMPQSVVDPEILLGLTAWHLYPDINVIGPKIQHIEQKDELFQTGGVLTLGVQSRDPTHDDGIFWSLPLSHIRYYGEPYIATSSLGMNSSRITVEELGFVALASVIRGWSIGSEANKRACEIIKALYDFLACGSGYSSFVPGWLRFLAGTANTYLSSRPSRQEELDRLMKFAQRRGLSFLSTSKATIPAVFGLLDVSPYLSILKHEEARIMWARRMAFKYQGKEDGVLLKDALIEYLPGALEAPFTDTDDLFKTREWSFAGNTATFSRGVLAEEYLKVGRVPEFATLVESETSENGLLQHGRRIPATHDHPSEVARSNRPGHAAILRWAQLESDTGEMCGLFPRLFEEGGLAFTTRKGTFFTASVEPDTVAVPVVDTTLNAVRHSFQTLPAKLSQVSSPRNLYQHISPPNLEIPSEILGEGGQSVTKTWTVVSTSFNDPTFLKFLGDCERYLISAEKDMNSILWKATGALTKSFFSTRRDTHTYTQFESLPPIPCALDDCCWVKHGSEWYKYQYYERIEGPTVPEKYVIHLGSDSSIGLSADAVFEIETPHITSPACSYRKLATGSDSFVIHVPETYMTTWTVSIDDILQDLKMGVLSRHMLSNYLNELCIGDFQTHFKSLEALRFAADVYASMPSVGIALRLVETTVCTAKWAPIQALKQHEPRAFACIAMCETGSIDIDPLDLADVMAMSAGNSLFIADFLITDPYPESRRRTIRRIPGNIGKPGISFLISPKEPNIRKGDFTSWRSVNYADFDGRLENNLTSTSFHLSFTGYELPLNTGDMGFYDKGVYFRQAVIRAFDRGEWVADLDITSAVNDPSCKSLCARLPRSSSGQARDQQVPDQDAFDIQLCNHGQNEQDDFSKWTPLTAIDTWAEILDPPSNVCIVRAHGNWLARLAVTTVLLQRLRPVVLASEKICWACASQSKHRHRNDLTIIC